MLVAAALVGVLSAGPWVWPVDGAHTVLRAFDPPATRFAAGHRGADLAVPVGTAVRAAGAGRVSYAGLLAGRGVVVVVHGELRTTYEPVAADVRVGTTVTAGEVVGHLTTGTHCGSTPCLHWGLLRGSTYLDPVQLVRRGPSRLLPVDGDTSAAVGVTPAVAAPSPATVRPAAEPAFSLRADEAPWGAGAVLALLAGLVLLRPSRQPPSSPMTPALIAQPAAPEPAELVDLVAERARRRA